MECIWKDIDGLCGLYKVSNAGLVKSIKKRISRANKLKYKQERILKGAINIWGYPFIGLTDKNRIIKNYSIHRLVANAFIPNPGNKPCVNHKDGNKLNNHTYNLEWVTYSENERHSCRVLGKSHYQPMKGKFGEDHNRSKGVTQYSLDGKFISDYGSSYEALRVTKISQGNISSCVRGDRKTAGGYIWKYTLKQ